VPCRGESFVRTLKQACSQDYPRAPLAFKNSMIHMFCNSHYVSHFAAFFIDVGAKISSVTSFVLGFVGSPPPAAARGGGACGGRRLFWFVVVFLFLLKKRRESGCLGWARKRKNSARRRPACRQAGRGGAPSKNQTKRVGRQRKNPPAVLLGLRVCWDGTIKIGGPQCHRNGEAHSPPPCRARARGGGGSHQYVFS
jgi:hypothetical protein